MSTTTATFKPEEHQRPGWKMMEVVELDYWHAEGQSRYGKQTKRDGQRVQCGHQHKSEAAAEACARRMEKDDVGHCQRYAASHFQGYAICYKRKPKRRAAE